MNSGIRKEEKRDSGVPVIKMNSVDIDVMRASALASGVRLKIWRFLKTADKPMRVTDISRQLGIDKSLCYRSLVTLIEAGLVMKNRYYYIAKIKKLVIE